MVCIAISRLAHWDDTSEIKPSCVFLIRKRKVLAVDFLKAYLRTSFLSLINLNPSLVVVISLSSGVISN